MERTYSGSGVYPGRSEAALVTELRLPSSLTNIFATGVTSPRTTVTPPVSSPLRAASLATNLPARSSPTAHTSAALRPMDESTKDSLTASPPRLSVMLCARVFPIPRGSPSTPLVMQSTTACPIQTTETAAFLSSVPFSSVLIAVCPL